MSLAAVVLAGAASLATAPHPFHTTVAEVELDVETARLEVAMRAEGFVVEEMLTLRHARRVDLDRTADVDALLLEELRRAFVVTPAHGQAVELRWVGKQVGERELWLYFEADLPEGLHGATIANTWGTTFADDQVNTLHLRQAGFDATLETTARAPGHAIEFDEVDRLETLLWMSDRAAARGTSPELAARLRLRCAEVALELDDPIAAGAEFARAWPTVRADPGRRDRLRRALAIVERLARARSRRVLAARVDAELERLGERDAEPDVARLDELVAALAATAPPR